MSWPRMVIGRRFAPIVALFALVAASAHTQTIDDTIMMSRNQLCTGFLYTHDSWNEYWEGRLQRTNGNIGTISTQSVSWVGNYGLSDRLNLIAMVPYVWTRASAGVLSGMDGLQDVTVAAKYHLLTTDVADSGSLRAFVVASASAPASDYTPDFYPLSIGSASRRLSARLTLGYKTKGGWFGEASSAYTWRGNVTLDRPAYFADDRLYLSDEVAMPDVFDYSVRAGYARNGLLVPISFSQQITRGGSDIRRQDMPFISYRMNASKVDATAMYYLPKITNLAVRLGVTYTVRGRNVGQATTLTGGLLYRVQF